MRGNRQYTNKTASCSTAGFTVLELIILVTMTGIVSAIALPNWIAFVERQHLNTAQSKVYQAMQEAKSNATRDKLTWQASFRQVPVDGKEVVQWSVHRASITPSAESWHNLEANVRLDDETSLPNSANGRRVRFNYSGCPVYQLNDECGQTTILSKGRITLSSAKGGKAKRCVIVSTLLGALRTAKEQPKTDKKGRYCY
jgi:type II secretory pathway pseudopilin PulG